MLQRHDRSDGRKAAERWRLDCYIEGWAKADPDRILDATAHDYCFHDPLVGQFVRASLPRYFALLQERFARAGAIRQHDLAFSLHGPMIGTRGLQFWREAPRIGLTGVTEIVAGPHGIVAERVSYDLNLASDLLRRAEAPAQRLTPVRARPSRARA